MEVLTLKPVGTVEFFKLLEEAHTAFAAILSLSVQQEKKHRRVTA